MICFLLLLKNHSFRNRLKRLISKHQLKRMASPSISRTFSSWLTKTLPTQLIQASWTPSKQSSLLVLSDQAHRRSTLSSTTLPLCPGSLTLLTLVCMPPMKKQSCAIANFHSRRDLPIWRMTPTLARTASTFRSILRASSVLPDSKLFAKSTR